ncbi:efflux RND transporter permease subunit [Paracoccaceae bacterium Fryx2]|nr:efflux RND transporter permease subunit [Paracoccaceae bacterium Fryx2]
MTAQNGAKRVPTIARNQRPFSAKSAAMAIGIFCVYAVLVLLFHDFLQPFTILMALPLALGGALFPLVITGTSFSMPSVIGLLLLMGIVTKNSILLVDYVIEARVRGMARFEALVDACHKRTAHRDDDRRDVGRKALTSRPRAKRARQCLMGRPPLILSAAGSSA